MRGFLLDLRYSLRGLSRNPGFAVACVATLALGIGANVAIFSAVDTLLLRPLPYPQADRMVMIWEDATFQGFPRNTPAVANYVDWRAQNQVFTDLAALRFRGANLTGEGIPESVPGRGTTANFFRILGVQPAVGRAYTEAEDRSSARVVVLSHGLWTRRYGADPALIGRSIAMNGEPWTVIGVMPRSFRFPDSLCAFWAPASFTPQQLAARGNHFLTVVGRLRDGVTLEQARGEMRTVAARLEKQYPDTNTRIGAVVVPLREQMAGSARLGLMVLLAASGCVLLIACANVANLLLARGAARRREMAVRAALGAGARRLILQMLTESVLLAGLGGAAGVALAYAGLAALEKMIPLGFAGDARLALDLRLLLFAVVVSVATGLFFGIAPAVTAARWSLVDAIKQGGRGVAGAASGFRKGLVVAEVALSALLLISAGLLIQTLLRLRGVDPGFRPDHLLTMIVALPTPKYAEPASRDSFERAVLDKVRALPGVQAAAFASTLPFMSIGNTVGFVVEGQPAAGPGDNRDVMARVGSTSYLRTLGVTLREGRFFTDGDRADSQQAVIVNEFMAKTFWAGQSAVGKRIKANGTGPNDPWRVIVGVVADISERGFELPQKYAVYAPFSQWRTWRPQYLAVRTAQDAAALTAPVRDAIWSVDRDQPVAQVRTMETVLDDAVGNRRTQVQLTGAFAVLALVLAAIGLYGVLSYGVAQRGQEIGVRMALGASPAEVARMVVWQGARLSVLGLAIGGAAALWVTQAFRTLLFGIPPRDPATYAVVAGSLLVVAAIACYLPARRAARVDPMTALRQE